MGSERSAESRVILESFPAQDGRPTATYRIAGDRFVLVEFADMVLDLTLSFQVLGLNEALQQNMPAGLVETVPALRSMLLRYDDTLLSAEQLIDDVQQRYQQLPPFNDLVLPSRVVELPIAFDDRWSREAIVRYVNYQRADAPNIINGNNIEYAARYNGLNSAEEFCQYIMDTDWWTAALGFFPGLPFAYPLDPRRAVVIPKYNPTRQWTPEGAVGIAGPTLAIYPVESAGGYQLIGATIPVYDPRQRNPAFKANPILLRPGDRIRFRPRVTDDELAALREQVYDGTYRYVIDEHATFNVGEYLAFRDAVRQEAEAFQRRQHEGAQRTPVP